MFCELTCVVGGAKTSVVVDSVDAGGAVLTVVVFAVVGVGLASGALEAQRTLAAAVACNRHMQLFSELYGLGDSKARLAHMYSPSSSSSTRQVPPLAQGLLTQAFSAVSQFLP